MALYAGTTARPGATGTADVPVEAEKLVLLPLRVYVPAVTMNVAHVGSAVLSRQRVRSVSVQLATWLLPPAKMKLTEDVELVEVPNVHA